MLVFKLVELKLVPAYAGGHQFRVNVEGTRVSVLRDDEFFSGGTRHRFCCLVCRVDISWGIPILPLCLCPHLSFPKRNLPALLPSCGLCRLGHHCVRRIFFWSCQLNLCRFWWLHHLPLRSPCRLRLWTLWYVLYYLIIPYTKCM